LNCLLNTTISKAKSRAFAISWSRSFRKRFLEES